MPFDPTWPPTNAELESAPFREQFNALKSLIDTLAAQNAALAAQAEPIGTIKAWAKSFPGVPPHGPYWAECNGQVLSDPESPMDGMTLMDLNGVPGRFLRGDATSGNIGGIESFATVDVDFTGAGATHSCVSPESSPGAVPFPPYYTVVWIIRVK